MPHFDWAIATDGLLGALVGGIAIAGTAFFTIRRADQTATTDRGIRADEAQRDRQSAADIARDDRQHAEDLAQRAREMDAADTTTDAALDVIDALYEPAQATTDLAKALHRRMQRLFVTNHQFVARVELDHPSFAATVAEFVTMIGRACDAADQSLMESVIAIYCGHINWWSSRPAQVREIAPTAAELVQIGSGWPPPAKILEQRSVDSETSS